MYKNNYCGALANYLYRSGVFRSTKNSLLFTFGMRYSSVFNLIYFFFMFISFAFMFLGCILCYNYLKLTEISVNLVSKSTVGFFCFDAISIGLIFITLTIFPWCYLYVFNKHDRHAWAFYLFITEILVFMAFLSIDLLFFFIVFEILIFPMYKIILGWGSQGDLRLTAARSFVMYTVLGSIILLFVIIYLYSVFGSTNIMILRNFNWYLPDFLLLIMFLAFATKVPTFPFYHWLTLAHVEASTVGSVILAALILKLGGYGFIRFLLPMYREHFSFYLWRHVALSLFIISILFAALSALVQTDIKRIVAYSSIEHINLSIIGLALCSTTSVAGAYMIILAHGWVAAGLFFAVGWVYDFRHQRDILYYRGYAIVEGWWSVFFGLLLLANIGFPLTLNFFGEIQILFNLFGQYTELLLLIFIAIMANVVYTLKLGYILWGTPYNYLLNDFKYFSGTNKKFFRAFTLCVLLGVPLFLVIVSAHPEYYTKISILLDNTLSYWRVVSRATTWPWTAIRWI